MHWVENIKFDWDISALCTEQDTGEEEEGGEEGWGGGGEEEYDDDDDEEDGTVA